ncbi:MAG: hypothetical protein KDK75_12165, partial [Alphaproteobacteria bacterium]|nr:hypothetical protein [Alphaproteobacteria bacterium]
MSASLRAFSAAEPGWQVSFAIKGKAAKTTAGGMGIHGTARERKNGLLMRYKFVLAGILAFFLSVGLPVAAPSAWVTPAHAQVVSQIVVQGNQRVENDTVLSYMQLSPGDQYDVGRVDESIKALFQTGLFSDVRMFLRGNVLVVQVEENPMINRV